jgi:hypothetical protein
MRSNFQAGWFRRGEHSMLAQVVRPERAVSAAGYFPSGSIDTANKFVASRSSSTRRSDSANIPQYSTA